MPADLFHAKSPILGMLEIIIESDDLFEAKPFSATQVMLSPSLTPSRTIVPIVQLPFWEVRVAFSMIASMPFINQWICGAGEPPQEVQLRV